MTTIAALVTVAPGHQLQPDAAAAYLRMLTDGCPVGITSSTRSYSKQLDWWQHQGQPGYPPMADHPDRSKHVWRPDDTSDKGARALDLPEPARAWVRAHGAPYGWAKDRVPGEDWHMEYEPWNDRKKEDDDMPSAAEVARELAKLEAFTTLTKNAATAAKQASRAATRIGGSIKGPTVTQMIRGLDPVDEDRIVSGLAEKLRDAGVKTDARALAQQIVGEIGVQLAKIDAPE